jgi:excinuclease ABC subunit A
MGPEGGNRGGECIFEGRPEELINNEKSYTGKYLRPLFEKQNKI